MVNDGDPETYWSTPDKVKSASVTIDLGSETEVNRVLLEEYIKLGQRVSEFSVHALVGNEWKQVAEGTTIGNKVIRKFPLVKTSKIRVSIDNAKACPALSNVELYRAPDE
jgi:alpha-L-fucosidase